MFGSGGTAGVAGATGSGTSPMATDALWSRFSCSHDSKTLVCPGASHFSVARVPQSLVSFRRLPVAASVSQPSLLLSTKEKRADSVLLIGTLIMLST